MGLTLSHLSALDALRTIRAEGLDVASMSTCKLVHPEPWRGKRWSIRAFESSDWRWGVPSASNPLEILVPSNTRNARLAHVVRHRSYRNMPIHSVLQLDDTSSMVCPELLFVQLSEVFTFSRLVLLGYELCGNFSRSALRPLSGDVVTHIPSATSVERIRSYLASLGTIPEASKACRALAYVADGALSAPEAVLATMYTLPKEESGYGMGPVGLNERVTVDGGEDKRARYRFPDILFPFAPIGINYDGGEHLDLEGIEQLARELEHAEGAEHDRIRAELDELIRRIRAKYVDDIRRNRALMAAGKLVLPATKEDLYKEGGLDALTRCVLACARIYFDVDVSAWERLLDDTEAARDRKDLLTSLLPGGQGFLGSHGTM